MNICYTVIFGNYDDLWQPKRVDGWEYICITDTSYKSDVWEIVKVPDNGNPLKTARYWKIMGHDFLNIRFGKINSVYVDGAVEIKGDLNIWTKDKTENLVMMRHPARKDIKTELAACISMNKDDKKIMTEQVNDYYNQGYVDESLVQSTIMLRRGDTMNAMLKWWIEVRDKSSRDQLSFGYAMWKAEQKYRLINWDSKNFIWHKRHK